MVREIINTFKFHMLPELMGDPGTSRDFVTPDTFDISPKIPEFLTYNSGDCEKLEYSTKSTGVHGAIKN